MNRWIRLSLLGCCVMTGMPGTDAAEPPNQGGYRQLERLYLATKIDSFPKPSEAVVQLWIQESASHGRLRTADVDRWPVDATARFFGASAVDYDVKNVAIISDRGLNVRFVDPTRKAVSAVRGDVVVLLRSKPRSASQSKTDSDSPSIRRSRQP